MEVNEYGGRYSHFGVGDAMDLQAGLYQMEEVLNRRKTSPDTYQTAKRLEQDILGIKKEDFELTKYARHLMEADKEKLELMRKIDTLERLVSKIRRREMIR